MSNAFYQAETVRKTHEGEHQICYRFQIQGLCRECLGVGCADCMASRYHVYISLNNEYLRIIITTLEESQEDLLPNSAYVSEHYPELSREQLMYTLSNDISDESIMEAMNNQAVWHYVVDGYSFDV